MKQAKEFPLQIVILTNGFVYIGEVELTDGWLIIHTPQNIRVWGTSNGLGELAIKGPLTNTKLDRCGIVRAPLHSLISLMECDEKKWQTRLK